METITTVEHNYMSVAILRISQEQKGMTSSGKTHSGWVMWITNYTGIPPEDTATIRIQSSFFHGHPTFLDNFE